MSGSRDPSKDQQFWRALASEEPVPVTSSNPDNEPCSKPVELTHDLSHLDIDQREARRKALKSMLSANEARQQSALRNRRPTLSVGQRVAIINGTLAGKQGTVLDADFIHGRVQLDINGASDPLWVSFKRIGSIQAD